MTADASVAVRFVISVNYRVTEVSACRNGEVIWQSPISQGGVDWIFSLCNYLRLKHNLVIGRLTAESILVQIGFASEPLTMLIQGRDLNTGKPRAQEITAHHLTEAFNIKFFA